MKVAYDTVVCDVDDGTFELTAPIGHGEIPVTVAAASDTDLRTAGTAVERLTI